MKTIYLIVISLVSFQGYGQSWSINVPESEYQVKTIPSAKLNYNAPPLATGGIDGTDPSTIIPEYIVRGILAEYGLAREFQDLVGTQISNTIIINNTEYQTSDPFQYMYGYNYDYGFSYVTGPIYYNHYGQGIQYLYSPRGVSMRIY